MSLISEIAPISLTYPTARIRGRRMTRLPEQLLDWAVLDAATADDLGREHVGWFVGNHPGFTRAAEQLCRLDANPEGGVWVVIPSGRQMSCDLFGRQRSCDLLAQWPYPEHVIGRPSSTNSVWRSRKVWVAIPEDLKKLLPFAKEVAPGIAGLIILDPDCLIYQNRGGTDRWGHKHRNDRPQHVVNFRADLEADGWQPPILLLTEKRAKAVNTVVVARAFSLNAFQFISGDSFDCCDAPTDKD